MKKHVYYESTQDDKDRIAELVRKFNGIVGHLPEEQEKLILMAYQSDFNPSTIHSYDRAWQLLDMMLGRINMSKAATGLATQLICLSNLYQEIRAEQTYLSGIFREFEAEGIYVD